MARRRLKKVNRRNIPIVYTRNGVTVRHVDITLDQLPEEVKRLSGVMADVLRLLARAPRLKHPKVEYVRFQLMYSPYPLDPTTTPERWTQEIGRLNFIMNEALKVLEQLKTPIPVLKEACFRLRYRQTSKKREAGWNSFKGDRDNRDHESMRDPEEPTVDSDY